MQSPLSALVSHAVDVRTRVRFAALLLLVCSTFLAIVLDLRTVRGHPPRKVEDPVRQHEDRMRRVRELLPARSVIGYVSDVEGMELLRRLYMTQYTLAPLLVVSGVQSDVVLGDFTRSAPAGREKTGLRVLHDLGDGVVLLTPAKP